MIKTASLEPSQRLVALGVVLDTFFRHHEHHTESYGVIQSSHPYYRARCTYPAPTADELLERTKKWQANLFWHNVREKWFASMGDVAWAVSRYEDNPADALALCVCDAIEHGKLTKEEVMKGAGR